MILYFSGTGNSRYAAKCLGKMLNDEVLSINERISTANARPLRSDRPFVFVVPTYCYHIPSVVERYIESAEFFGSKKVFFVMTCGGGIGSSPASNRALCDKKGLEYMGTEAFIMPDNYLLMYEPTSEAEAISLVNSVKERLAQLVPFILEERALHEKKYPLGNVISSAGSRLFNAFFVKPEKFFTSDRCISCGVCAMSCPMRNIELVDGRPQWSGSCAQCLACICICPKNAIEYGKGTPGRRRHYLYPDGRLK